MTTLRQRLDSWKNALTGLGGERDKRKATAYVRSTTLDDVTLDDLYHNNDLAALICDVWPEEALRQGFKLQIEEDTDDPEDPEDDPEEDPAEVKRDAKDQTKELQSAVLARAEELGVVASVLEAAIWGNVYGAGCVMLGVDDGQAVDRPLIPEKVRKIRYLTVLDKRDLTPQTWYTDPFAPKYGKPETFGFVNALQGRGNATAKAVPVGQRIHESRLIFFYGARTSKRRVLENAGWPYSKLQKVYDVLRDFDMGFEGAAYLMQEASQAVYKVHGLLDILASKDGKTQLETRMQLIDMSRSVAKALIVDAEHEDFERKPTTFTGVSDVLDRFCNRLAAATKIPVTILMGMAPAGLNATGASDIRQFYDRIKGYQTDVMGPALESIIRLLILEQNAGQEPGSWKVVFPSLYQMTDLETAELRALVAQTDKLYVDMQALSPEEIVLNRFTADGWSMETVVDLDLREKLQDLETENMLERKENPPVPVVVDPNNPEAKPGEVPAKPPAKPPAKEDPNA